MINVVVNVEIIFVVNMVVNVVIAMLQAGWFAFWRVIMNDCKVGTLQVACLGICLLLYHSRTLKYSCLVYVLVCCIT